MDAAKGKLRGCGQRTAVAGPPFRDGVEGRLAPLIKGQTGKRLDPYVDFELYREATYRRFKTMASGYRALHDLSEIAKDLYDDFWLELLERPNRELCGAPVPYIAGAMLKKLVGRTYRGRSVHASQLVRADSETIITMTAAQDLQPGEKAILQEQLWRVREIVQMLPERQRVVLAAVIGRDSKKKEAPLAGYELAAAKLGISRTRAKKLAHEANLQIRAAVEQIESGNWCDHWVRSIELVAVGQGGEQEFRRHAAHCLQCQTAVVHLRHQATIERAPNETERHWHRSDHSTDRGV